MGTSGNLQGISVVSFSIIAAVSTVVIVTDKAVYAESNLGNDRVMAAVANSVMIGIASSTVGVAMGKAVNFEMDIIVAILASIASGIVAGIAVLLLVGLVLKSKDDGYISSTMLLRGTFIALLLSHLFIIWFCFLGGWQFSL